MPDRRIVDQSVKGAEFPAQFFDQIGNLLDLAEVERLEVERRVIAMFRFGNRFRHVFALLPSHGDHLIADGGQLAGNAEAKATAGASDENVARGFGHGGFTQPRRASLPVAATARAGTKLMETGTLWRGSASRQSLRISFRTSDSCGACWSAGFKTTSATTMAPVIGLCLERTSDIRTDGCRLMTAS